MHRTQRYWGALGIAIFFALLGFSLDQSLFLFPVGILLGWLLALEFLFRSHAAAISDAVTVSYELSQDTIQTDQPITIITKVQNINLTDLRLILSPTHPDVAVCSPDRSAKTLDTDASEDSISRDCHFPFAGSYTIGPASITIESTYGFFETTVTSPSTATITVEAEDASSMHIGKNGTQFATRLGDHGIENSGEGMTPAGVRTYMPGDPASRINWKATARLDELYVREFEIETVRPLAVFFDRRQASENTLYENPVEYRRHIAISLVREAEANSDPVGLYDVGSTQMQASQQISTNSTQYMRIRRQLYDTTSDDVSDHSTSMSQTHRSTVDRDTAVTQLGTDQSPFGTKLSPFLRGSATTTHEIENQPLIQTAQTYLKRQGENVRVAILSDDQRQAELYETAKLAGQLSQEVLIFITPTVLFESEDIAAIDNVYARYSAFERYRSQLDTLENVTAFEVTPGSKLKSIIEQNRTRNQ